MEDSHITQISISESCKISMNLLKGYAKEINNNWGMHVSHVIFISKFAGYENPGQSIGI